jgi:hypothetical protein
MATDTTNTILTVPTAFFKRPLFWIRSNEQYIISYITSVTAVRVLITVLKLSATNMVNKTVTGFFNSCFKCTDYEASNCMTTLNKMQSEAVMALAQHPASISLEWLGGKNSIKMVRLWATNWTWNLLLQSWRTNHSTTTFSLEQQCCYQTLQWSHLNSVQNFLLSFADTGKEK